MKKFWSLFFCFWPILAIVVCWISPDRQWWFPNDNAPPRTPIGERIDGLFYMILVITTVVFIGTQIALGYVLLRGAQKKDGPALFTHGSHSLEVIWTIAPAGVLLFVALYQLDVWADFRITSNYSQQARSHPIAEVTARQFEWRIRYPSPDRTFPGGEADVKYWLRNPQPDDLYTVNDLHVPTGRQIVFHLRSADVQHSFFVPELRVKQDAVPGLIIPVKFEVPIGDQYELLCAELCGWGHYKMKARVWAQPEEDYRAYLQQLKKEQFFDGIADEPQDSAE